MQGNSALDQRWKLVKQAFCDKKISCSLELEKAILSYNSRYNQIWNFRGFHEFVDKVLLFSITEFFVVVLTLYCMTRSYRQPKDKNYLTIFYRASFDQPSKFQSASPELQFYSSATNHIVYRCLSRRLLHCQPTHSLILIHGGTLRRDSRNSLLTQT